MSRWTDPRVLELAVAGWGTPKALRKAVRQIKRAEATVRNAATPPEKRAGRCRVMASREIRDLAASCDRRGLRVRAGIRQRTIAAALGTSQATISGLERSWRYPRSELGRAYARVIAGLARHEQVTWDEGACDA